jgi:serine protease Do
MIRSVLLSIALSLSLLPACSLQNASSETRQPEPPKETKTKKPEPQVKLPSGAAALDRLPDVVEKTLPGVVGISTERTVRVPGSPFGGHPFAPFFGPGMQGPQERKQQGMGSGVIVSKDGIILTNNHVVDEADEIRVRLADNREFDAEIVGTDPKSDIAVVRMIDPPDDLEPVPFGDSEAIRLGEPVVAIGNPFGLSSTVTLGIVSAKGRANVGIVDYEDFIQTDAAINPGNSGGALINLDGELIGINTAILSRSGGYQGIGFAIPSNMARDIQQKLVTEGKVTRGWLGVMIQTMTPELADAFDVDPDVKGVIVSDVQENSPADQAGLKRGDIILTMNDQKVEDATELRNYVAMQTPGTTVGVEVLRDGQSMVIDVKLGELGGQGAAGGVTEGPIDGLTLAPVDPEFRTKFEVPDAVDGLGVVGVEPGSVAAKTGLRPGDVIREVNRVPVKTVADFQKAYKRSNAKVLFLVYRDGGTMFLAIPKPK